MTWVLTKIDPTTFNVVSDLIAKVIEGILLAVLGFVYPQMVWTWIQNGHGVDLDGIIAPPVSLMAAARQFFSGRGRPQQMLLIVSVILIVANFSHLLADVFLEFVGLEVEVSVHSVQPFCWTFSLNLSLSLVDSFSWLKAAWCIHLQVDRRQPVFSESLYYMRK
jgi:hypothetical protein